MLSSIARNVTQPMGTTVRNMSAPAFWSHVEMGPPDPILGLTEAFKKDSNPNKMNLGVGAYRDDAGKPFILPVVREAERLIVDGLLDHEYAGITGVPAFVRVAPRLALGDDSSAITQNRVVTAQTISGTGALRVAGDFLAKFAPSWTPSNDIYFPTPTWGNHNPIFKNAGFNVKNYRYFDKETNLLDTANMVDDIAKAPEKSIILLHTCAHNPTGVDPTPEDWDKILDVVKSRNHYCLFDTAYQGFASGDPEKDAAALRKFVDNDVPLAFCQSFAKNFGLYGQRAGAFNIVCSDEEEKNRVESQLKILIRPMYSNPPIHGARLVATILENPELNAQWRAEVQIMANRIIDMRHTLVHSLKAAGSTKNWDHVIKQIGMFTYTGLGPDAVDALREKYSIYMTKDGRISVSGVTTGNVDYLANAIHEVTK